MAKDISQNVGAFKNFLTTGVATIPGSDVNLADTLETCVGALGTSPTMGGGNVYWAIQDTEAFYAQFLLDHPGTYPDGSAKVYTTIQGAIDACTANRGDIVYVVGEWTSAVTITLNKWGTSLIGATNWNNITGGGNSNITCTGAGIATLTVTKAKCHVENLVLYANGTGATKGIEFASSVPSQAIIRNVEIVKNGGDSAAGYGICGTTVPVRACFENIKITGNSTHSLKWAVGIQSASYGCVWKNIIISDTSSQAFYNVGTSSDVFYNITCLPSCATGLQIGGTDAGSSVIQHCHVLAGIPGTSTAIISESYIAGLSAYTG